MNGLLLRVLIAKDFFQKGIEVDATYMGQDLSGCALVRSTGTFTVLSFRLIGDEEVAIQGANVVDGRPRVFYAQSLLKIDGMCPIRFAASCGIDKEGKKIQEGKRRGRKPKVRIPVAMNEDEAQASGIRDEWTRIIIEVDDNAENINPDWIVADKNADA